VVTRRKTRDALGAPLKAVEKVVAGQGERFKGERFTNRRLISHPGAGMTYCRPRLGRLSGMIKRANRYEPYMRQIDFPASCY
jgi:hypothetical protein